MNMDMIREFNDPAMSIFSRRIFNILNNFQERAGTHVQIDESYIKSILNNPVNDFVILTNFPGTGVSGKLQRIAKRFETIFSYKHSVREWPIAVKMTRLAIFTKCSVLNCTCVGWLPNNPEHFITLHREAQGSELCQNQNCRHTLNSHTNAIDRNNVKRVNDLTSLLFDMEILYLNKNHIEDLFVKKLYQSMYAFVRQCIAHSELPRRLNANLLHFSERPNITDIISNFIIYKYDSCTDHELRLMVNAAKPVLNYINNYYLIPPYLRHDLNNMEKMSYHCYFVRWFTHTYVPKFCTALQAHEPALMFGRRFLRLIIDDLKRGLISLAWEEMNCLEGSALSVIKKVPEFMVDFKNEIVDDASPLWDPNFMYTVTPRRITTFALN